MRTIRNPSPIPPPDDQSDNHRQKGRLKVEYLVCRHGKKTYGKLLDLSASGMRIFRKGRVSEKQGDILGLTLVWSDTEIPVKAHIKWIKKVGFRKHLIGIAFDSLSPSTATAIQQLCLTAKVSLTIASDLLENRR